MLYLHNDIFVTYITGDDRLKYSESYTPKNKILGTPLPDEWRGRARAGRVGGELTV